MPSTREIRRRIRSVKNIAQITKAMQMVASSKMRRAQERVEQSRPYAEQLRALVSRLANVTGEDLGDERCPAQAAPCAQHRLRADYAGSRPVRRIAQQHQSQSSTRARWKQQKNFAEQGQRPGIEYVAVGRKGRDFVMRNQFHLIAEFTNYGDRPSLLDASAIAQVATDAFLKEEVDVVYLVYAKFVNTVTQQPTVVQLLPVQPPADEGRSNSKSIEYIYEPDAASIFEALLPRYVDVLVYQALLEMLASLYSAQMVAMKNATDNANDLIQDLTLTYNKARQASYHDPDS